MVVEIVMDYFDVFVNMFCGDALVGLQGEV